MSDSVTVSIGGNNYGWILAGDDNVIITAGDLRVSVPAPRDVAELRVRLFGDETPPTAPSRRSVVSWLSPSAGIVPRQPRAEVDELRRWVLTDDESTVRLVTGQGGQGKTTMAAMLCEALQADDIPAGFLRLPPTAWKTVKAEDRIVTLTSWLNRWAEIIASLQAAAGWPDPPKRILLIVDYAENQTEGVGDLLTQIAHPPTGSPLLDKVRVLCLARSSGDWWRSLSIEHAYHDWIESEPVDIPSVTASMSDEQEEFFWRSAVQAFAEKVNVTLVSIPPEHWTRNSRLPVGCTHVRSQTTLEGIATALLAVLDETLELPARSGNPLVGVMEHELRLQRQAFTAAGLPLSWTQVDEALVAAYLSRPTDLDEACRLLASPPSLADSAPIDLRRLAMELAATYPDAATLWSAPLPDAIPDTHVLHVLEKMEQAGSAVKLVTGILSSVSERDPMLLARCARIVETPLSAARFTKGVRRLHESVREAAALSDTLLTQGLELAPASLSRTLRQAIDAASPDVLRATLTSVNHVSPSLDRAPLLAKLSREVLKTAPEEAVTRAFDLSQVAARAQMAGNPRESIRAGEEAVVLLRPMVGSGDLRPNTLAVTLYHLTSSYQNVGNQEAAVAAGREAYELSSVAGPQLLSFTDREKIDLVTNYLGALVIAKRYRDAGPVIQRVLDSLGPLEAHIPAQGTISTLAEAKDVELLANAYNHLAIATSSGEVQFAAPSEDDVALRFTHRAVELRDSLYQFDPRTFMPDLAGALGNEGAALLRRDRADEAIEVLTHAVHLHRELTEANPRQFVRDLAIDLSRLSAANLRSGRLLAAEDAARQALDAWRTQSMMGDGAAFGGLATALINLADIRDARGDEAGAVDLMENAVTDAERAPGVDGQVTLAEALLRVARVYLRKKNLARARAAALRVQEISRRLPDHTPIQDDFTQRALYVIAVAALLDGDEARAGTLMASLRRAIAVRPDADSEPWRGMLESLETASLLLDADDPEIVLDSDEIQRFPLDLALSAALKASATDETRVVAADRAEQELAEIRTSDPEQALLTSMQLIQLYNILDRQTDVDRIARAAASLSDANPTTSPEHRVFAYVQNTAALVREGLFSDARQAARKTEELLRSSSAEVTQRFFFEHLLNLANLFTLAGDRQRARAAVETTAELAGRLTNDEADPLAVALRWLEIAVMVFEPNEEAIFDELSGQVEATIQAPTVRAWFMVQRFWQDPGIEPAARAQGMTRGLALAETSDDESLIRRARQYVRALHYAFPAEVDEAFGGETPDWARIPQELADLVDAMLHLTDIQEVVQYVTDNPELLGSQAREVLADIGADPKHRQRVALFQSLLDDIANADPAYGKDDALRFIAFGDFVRADAETQDRLWRDGGQLLDADAIGELTDGSAEPAHRRAHAIAALHRVGIEADEARGFADVPILLALLDRWAGNLSAADVGYLAEMAFDLAGEDDAAAARSGSYLAWSAWRTQDVTLAHDLLVEARERDEESVTAWLELWGALPNHVEEIRALAESQAADAPSATTAAADMSLSVFSSYASLKSARPEQLSEQIQRYEDALARSRPGSGDSITLRNNLAGAYQLNGRTDEVLRLLRTAETDAKNLYSIADRRYVVVAVNLAKASIEAGNPEVAESLLQPVLTAMQGTTTASIADVTETLAHAYLARDDYGSAIPHLETARAERLQRHGADDLTALVLGDSLGRAYLNAGRTAEALSLLKGIRIQALRLRGPDHSDNVVVGADLFTAYLRAGDLDSAAGIIAELRQVITRLGDRSPISMHTLDATLADAYMAANRPAEGVDIYRYLWQELRPLRSRDTVQAGVLLGQALRRTGEGDEATAILREVLELARSTAGPDTSLARQVADLLNDGD